jgi:hypothetical protein
MALGGFTPKQKLAMAAYRFYFWLPCKRGGLPSGTRETIVPHGMMSKVHLDLIDTLN